MDEPEVRKPLAWLPLTPRGVAAFSTASTGRILLVQALVAVLASATVVWSLHLAWFPAVESAIGNLPDAGDIRVGLLDWRGPETVTLAETHFLAFTVNLTGRDQPRTTSHLQVELRARTFKVDSLFGTNERIYPGRSITPLNRPELLRVLQNARRSAIPESVLLPNSQFLDQGTVALHILPLEIVEEVPLLGSVSARVVAEAACTVTAVRVPGAHS